MRFTPLILASALAFGQGTKINLQTQVQGQLPAVNVGNLPASKITSGAFVDTLVAQTNVTQHQTALAIATSQIVSGVLALARGGTNQDTWTASRCVQVNAGGTALESAATACGAGDGDITAVGDCATGDCFQAAAQNSVLAGLATGGAGQASMRALVDADIPAAIARGSGTANYLPRWTGSNALGDSVIFQSGSKIGIGMTEPEPALGVLATSAIGIGSISSAAVGPGSGGGFLAITANTPTAADQRLGIFIAGGITTGTTYLYPVRIQAFSSQAWSPSAAGAYVIFMTTPDDSITPVERMRIDQAGNVNIGGQVQFGTEAKWASGTEGTCNAANRGRVVMVQGGAGVADTFRVCSKDGADAYAWRALY